MTKEALKLALEVMQNQGDVSVDEWLATEKAIKEALAQPEQEPVVFWDGESRFVSQKTKEWDKRTGGTLGFGCDIALYTTPPQRTWVGLTDEEIKRLGDLDLDSNYFGLWYDFAKAIEAKLKEKNT